MSQHEGLFHLSYDSLKWFFSDYVVAKVKYTPDVHAILHAVAETILSLGYTIICDSVLLRENREKIISRARNHGYDIIEINIEANYDILEARFKERVERTKSQQSTRIANTSLDRFKELYEIYINEKNPHAIIFHSDILTPEEIIEEVSSSIKK